MRISEPLFAMDEREGVTSRSEASSQETCRTHFSKKTFEGEVWIYFIGSLPRSLRKAGVFYLRVVRVMYNSFTQFV